LQEENKDNTTPRDGQLQQYNASTSQTRGTRKRKIREEEEQSARPLKRVQSTKHPEGNTMAEKGSPYYRNFPESQQRNIHPTDNDSHANAGLQNSDVICYSNSILQVIASCTHLMKFFRCPPSKDYQRFRLYYEFANVIHSMVTGKPDVVNPYNFVEIFKSNHKKIVANECMYVL
jgi:ubiquitin C-terminal hydrolase